MAIEDFSFSSKKTSDPAKKQALLALQNEQDVDCLSKVLKKHRYHVLGKSHKVTEIVELLRKNRNGIFFLDIDIENLGSMDFLSKIKINCPNFKVVIAATKMEKQEIEEAKNHGIVGFLAKPITTDAIEKLLSKPFFD